MGNRRADKHRYTKYVLIAFVLVCVALLAWTPKISAKASTSAVSIENDSLFDHLKPDGKIDAKDSASEVSFRDLPIQGQETYRLIVQGGDFPYDKDGTVFGNRERLLPAEKRGYYREYTVKTPRARNRGARRIICGGKQMTKPDKCYYTDDHYATFKRIIFQTSTTP